MLGGVTLPTDKGTEGLWISPQANCEGLLQTVGVQSSLPSVENGDWSQHLLKALV